MPAIVSKLLGACLLLTGLTLAAQPPQGPRTPNPDAIRIDQASIAGVVLNSAGSKPEAGVWVVAETKSLPVPYRKIVVTDDQGRFVVPDLPNGSYELWVRGYGLKDSARVKASRGDHLTVQVSDADSPQDAAKIYPADYWTALFQVPSKQEIPATFTGVDHWVAAWRSGCNQCHQLGMAITRVWTEPDQWDSIFRRNSGMDAAADRLGRELLEKKMSEWDSRIAAGALPPAPARPVGLERDVVITQWDWADRQSFIHDVTSTDKRNPTLYPYGKVYGADRSKETLWALDPVKNTVTAYPLPTRDGQGHNSKADYYHDKLSAEDWLASPHNPMLDERGRVWMTTQIRPEGPTDNPKWARSVIRTEDSSPAALDAAYKLVEGHRHNLQLGYFDTETKHFVLVDTLYSNHHLQFDRQDRLWSNNPGDVISLGMLDTKKVNPDDPQATESSAQEAWVRIDPANGKADKGWGYAVAVSPIDGAIWQSDPETGGPNNKLYKFDPKTGKFTDYPLPNPGRVPHGIDFSTDGIVWFSAGSGHLGRFDPKTGKFTYWELPGPKFQGTGDETGSTEYPYFLWVDQFNASGLGKNTVIVNGTTSDSLLVFDPRTEKFSVLRIPYPMPFYTRGLDGRIDDAKAGWKGRGMWATYSSYLPRFTETRMGSVDHIQIRPNPLAY